MSYDLVVFDPSAAPAGPEEFLRWYEGQSEEANDISEVSGPHLRSFFLDLVQRFPALNGPHATDDFDDPRVTDYAFGPVSIYMCFAWSQADEARSAVVELAHKHSVGFYDISDPRGTTWRPGQPGESGDSPSAKRRWWRFWA